MVRRLPFSFFAALGLGALSGSSLALALEAARGARGAARAGTALAPLAAAPVAAAASLAAASSVAFKVAWAAAESRGPSRLERPPPAGPPSSPPGGASSAVVTSFCHGVFA